MTSYTTLLYAVRDLAHGIQPTFDLSETLYRHRCYYLLSHLSSPTAYTKKAATELALHRIILKERYRVCQPLFDALTKSGIPYAVIKGAVLSQSAYGNENCRFSGDIDLLVDRKDVNRLKQCMNNAGFMQGRITPTGISPFTREELLFHLTATHQTAPFILKTDHPLCPYVNVDINNDIFWGESEQHTAIQEWLNDTVTATIYDITVCVLPPEKAFVQLCLHHYKDLNSLLLLSTGSMSLSLFCDIYFFVCNTPMDPQTLLGICKETGATPYVGYCLYYTDRLFDTPQLQRYLSHIPTEEYVSLLDYYGLSPNKRKLWELSFEERLFSPMLLPYVQGNLSETELKIIRLNQKYM